MKRVRVGSKYRYSPSPWDLIDPPYGTRVMSDSWDPPRRILEPGDIVTVVKLPGCPPPGTMNHAHINGPGGEFAGLVSLNSLEAR